MVGVNKLIKLTTPLSDVKNLKIGDEVYISGTIFIMRDATLRRIFDEKVDAPVDLKDQVVFFGAPSYDKEGNKYKIISVGVTTGQRMERYLPGLLGKYGVKGIIAKGELSESVTVHFSNSVYFLFVGGAAALATSCVEDVENVWWEDLKGEAMFKVKVNNLGPLIVAIDTKGNNLLMNNMKIAIQNLQKILGD